MGLIDFWNNITGRPDKTQIPFNPKLNSNREIPENPSYNSDSHENISKNPNLSNEFPGHFPRSRVMTGLGGSFFGDIDREFAQMEEEFGKMMMQMGPMMSDIGSSLSANSRSERISIRTLDDGSVEERRTVTSIGPDGIPQDEILKFHLLIQTIPYS